MDNITRTNQAIDRKREDMIQASTRYGLSSNEVLKISQELDVLLNEFDRIREGLLFYALNLFNDCSSERSIFLFSKI